MTKISHRLILMLISSQEYGYNMVARFICYYVYTCHMNVVTTKIAIWRITIIDELDCTCISVVGDWNSDFINSIPEKRK